MNKKWKLMLPIVAALLLLSLMAPAVALAQTTTTATRDIADQTPAPGDTTQVTVTIDVAEAEALALDEDIPAGWTLTQVSEDPAASIYNANTNEWVWFQAAVGAITVVYDLTVPADATGSYTLAGTIVGEDWSEAVAGEAGITVEGEPTEATTATRDIADQTPAPGDTTQVTVTIDVAEAEALALDEDIPAGWTLTQVSEDPAASIYNANTNEWVWFQAAVGAITVVYDLTVPADATGSYTLAGTISGEDWSEALGGEAGITVEGEPTEATTATRDIANQTPAPGATTQVTVTIDVDEAEALALDEDIPTGWTLTQVSEDEDAYNANTNEWVWFQAAVGTITVVYDLTVPADATAGSYSITGTIGGADWSEAVGGEAEITVIVGPISFPITLPSGWNLLSTPILLDVDSDTLEQILGESITNIEASWRWDTQSQQWEVPTSYELSPLEAVYVKVSSGTSATAEFIPSQEQSGPPSRVLQEGLNLIGPAPLGPDFLDLPLDWALVNIEQVSGGLRGYTLVISPGLNQPGWAYVVGVDAEVEDLLAFNGYWVVMENGPDTLYGFSTTPISP